MLGSLTSMSAGHRRLRRDVLHEQNRQPLRRHFVHRPERDAVAVREGEVLVDPGAVRQALGVQLAGREHHLPQLAIDRVAIVVDRLEVVVRAQLLDLAERFEQRLMIPQPHVLDRVGVAIDVLARQLGVAGELRVRTVARLNACRVAVMLCVMYGVSAACSLGVTMNR